MKIGNIIANNIYKDISDRLEKENINPENVQLAVVLVGDNSASEIYIKYKKRACEKLGFKFNLFRLDKESSKENVLNLIRNINNDKKITGCIVQLPLPPHIPEKDILNAVSPTKDVDCFHMENTALLYYGYDSSRFIPATVLGIYRFIKDMNVETKGKKCVIIGKSNIVGKPLQLLLSDENDCACTTILCDKYTKNLKELTKLADILIVAAGVRHLIPDSDWVKNDAVVIDVGIHKVKVGDKYKVQGDVNYENVKDKCKIITPVPGGVGPMTVAGLMYNTLMAYKN